VCFKLALTIFFKKQVSDPSFLKMFQTHLNVRKTKKTLFLNVSYHNLWWKSILKTEYFWLKDVATYRSRKFLDVPHVTLFRMSRQHRHVAKSHTPTTGWPRRACLILIGCLFAGRGGLAGSPAYIFPAPLALKTSNQARKLAPVTLQTWVTWLVYQ